MDVSLHELALINLEKDLRIRRLEEQLAQQLAAHAADNGKVPEEAAASGNA